MIIDFATQIFQYLSKFGIIGNILGIFLVGLFYMLAIFVLVGGKKDMLIYNEDYKGKKYPWRNTILSIIVFIVSIPIVIGIVVFIFYPR